VRQQLSAALDRERIAGSQRQLLPFEAALGNHEKHLTKGEGAVIPLVAQDMRGSRIAFNYLKSYFTDSPLLKSMLEDEVIE